MDAARALFLSRGYAATTIEAISERSDVPQATVYRLFASKLGILEALLDVSVAGDDQGLTLQDRPQIAAIFAEPDPKKLLAGLVGISVAINTRSAGIYSILVSAAGSDPDALELHGNYMSMRDQGQGLIATVLARAGALRAGMKERDAADLLHALMSPDLYRLLVNDRGWTPRRYERWLTDALVSQLLLPATTE